MESRSADPDATRLALQRLTQTDPIDLAARRLLRRVAFVGRGPISRDLVARLARAAGDPLGPYDDVLRRLRTLGLARGAPRALEMGTFRVLPEVAAVARKWPDACGDRLATLAALREAVREVEDVEGFWPSASLADLMAALDEALDGPLEPADSFLFGYALAVDARFRGGDPRACVDRVLGLVEGPVERAALWLVPCTSDGHATDDQVLQAAGLLEPALAGDRVRPPPVVPPLAHRVRALERPDQEPSGPVRSLASLCSQLDASALPPRLRASWYAWLARTFAAARGWRRAALHARAAVATGVDDEGLAALRLLEQVHQAEGDVRAAAEAREDAADLRARPGPRQPPPLLPRGELDPGERSLWTRSTDRPPAGERRGAVAFAPTIPLVLDDELSLARLLREIGRRACDVYTVTTLVRIGLRDLGAVPAVLDATELLEDHAREPEDRIGLAAFVAQGWEALGQPGLASLAWGRALAVDPPDLHPARRLRLHVHGVNAYERATGKLPPDVVRGLEPALTLDLVVSAPELVEGLYPLLRRWHTATLGPDHPATRSLDRVAVVVRAVRRHAFDDGRSEPRVVDRVILDVAEVLDRIEAAASRTPPEHR